jgi:hypothetical protein
MWGPEPETTMRLIACISCLTALLLAPSLASAGPAPAANDDADAAARRTTPAGRTQEYIYGDEILEGELQSSDHERVDFRPPGKHPSLIKVRAHFIPQLLQMANDV